MIRPVTSADITAVVELVIAAELFTRSEATMVQEMYAAYFGGAEREGHFSLVDDDGGITGVAYCQPEPAADRVWDLTMIAVGPGHQRHGRGSLLLAAVESALRTTGQRLLLIRTSGTVAYDRAQAFYRARDYDAEATIRNYWTEGDDMIIFAKRLSADRGVAG